MALRSRISTIARPPAPAADEAGQEETRAVHEHIGTRGRIVEPVARPDPEPEIEPVPQTDAMQAPDLEAQAEAELDPEGYNGVTGNADDAPYEPTFGAPAADAPETVVTPVKRTRTRRMPEPTPEAEPVFDEPTTAPQLRLAIRDLEAAVKDARARHEIELSQLRQRHRELHDKLFDLVR